MPDLPDKSTQCQCPAFGFCERHGCFKNAHQWRLCQLRGDYFNSWEQHGPSWKKEKPATPESVAQYAGAGLSFGVCVLGRDPSGHNTELCYASIVADGFTNVTAVTNTDTRHAEKPATRATLWDLWRIALRKAIDIARASVIVVVSDANQCPLGSREILDRELWPSPRAGCVGIFGNQAGSSGMVLSNRETLLLQDTWVIPRHVAVPMLVAAMRTPDTRPGLFVADYIEQHHLEFWVYNTAFCKRVEGAALGVYDKPEQHTHPV